MGGLWVLELTTLRQEQDWPKQISHLLNQLDPHRATLEKLKDGSSDYTLHLAITTSSFQPISLTPTLLEFAVNCGFGIEVQIDSIE
ncbi:DUF4279 domain-containing protein [Luteolibacter pohnpeiensis]|uniref:DUF4279 domain-containing protein n=1 Tax=Luteolibacter pohnpeiensis TaxID=454153 RepID=A0A934SCK5_9BACT|nr:DUF4279 domain-containing protein [Luteolibacter pohnpeiensis]MBK1882783.1 DUF4279 domain-containing protein [Luteolibacter pohnpeiensis]